MEGEEGRRRGREDGRREKGRGGKKNVEIGKLGGRRTTGLFHYLVFVSTCTCIASISFSFDCEKDRIMMLMIKT